MLDGLVVIEWAWNFENAQIFGMLELEQLLQGRAIH